VVGVKREINKAIKLLENKGINSFTTPGELQTRGLGDAVEDVLTTLGITQERYTQWFNLKECKCTKRKEWLNNFFSWNVKD
jgi:hypothetical protein